MQGLATQMLAGETPAALDLWREACLPSMVRLSQRPPQHREDLSFASRANLVGLPTKWAKRAREPTAAWILHEFGSEASRDWLH